MRWLGTTITILLLSVGQQSFSQNQIDGEYGRGEYPGGHIKLNTDLSFKFIFHFDLQWDLACGTYSIKGDTIYFKYLTDMFNPDCNDQRINVTDTSGVILQDAIDSRYRPITARVVKNTLSTIIVSGPSIDGDTLLRESYLYKRKKGKTIISTSSTNKLQDGIYFITMKFPVRQRYRLQIDGSNYMLITSSGSASHGKINWVTDDSFELLDGEPKVESSSNLDWIHNGWGNQCYELNERGRKFRLTWTGNLHVTAGEGKIIRGRLQ